MRLGLDFGPKIVDIMIDVTHGIVHEIIMMVTLNLVYECSLRMKKKRHLLLIRKKRNASMFTRVEIEKLGTGSAHPHISFC